MRQKEKRDFQYQWSFLLLLGATGLAYFAVTGQSPEEEVFLVSSPEVYDFGRAKQGKLKGTFRLTNQSDKALQILHVLVTCDCGVVNVPRKKLKPGESIDAAFTWDVRGKRDETTSHFRIVFKLDAEKNVRYASCVCRGDIVPDFEYEPKELEFSFARKELQEATIKFWSTQKRFAVTDAICLHPAFSALCDVQGQEVSVTFDPSKVIKQDKNFSHKIEVKTNSENEPSCFVSVRLDDQAGAKSN